MKTAGPSVPARATQTSVPSPRHLGASPLLSLTKASSSWLFCRFVRMSSPPDLPFRRSGLRHTLRLLCPLLTSAPRSRPLRTAQSLSGTRRRPPEVRPAAFAAHPPNLPPRPLMAMDFAIICSLVRSGRPRIRFLSIGSRLCFTLPSDHASRHRPCASLILCP